MNGAGTFSPCLLILTRNRVMVLLQPVAIKYHKIYRDYLLHRQPVIAMVVKLLSVQIGETMQGKHLISFINQK